MINSRKKIILSGSEYEQILNSNKSELPKTVYFAFVDEAIRRKKEKGENTFGDFFFKVNKFDYFDKNGKEIYKDSLFFILKKDDKKASDFVYLESLGITRKRVER